MSGRLHVRMPLGPGWEELDGAPAVLARRYRRDGRVLAAASLEVLASEGATPERFAAEAEVVSGAWRRRVAVDLDADPVRVVVHDLDRIAPPGGGPAAIRRNASLTWFLPSGSCLQLRLVADDLLVIGDLGDAIRELADTVEWEEA